MEVAAGYAIGKPQKLMLCDGRAENFCVWERYAVSQTPLSISKVTWRRFVMGRQGLWPGRRWRGKDGAAQAIRSMEGVQLDPLNVVARSQDIALYGRVLDYRPDDLYTVAYQERAFFDYGGWLCLYPMPELPYWRLHMQNKQQKEYWRDQAAVHAQALDEVRRELAERGPLGNRDFSGSRRVNSYRGRKDTALALYYLWITGEVMIHHRDGFERVYDFDHRVAPPEHLAPAPQETAERHFARKSAAIVGLVREGPWITSLGEYLQRPLPRPEGRAWFQGLLAAGELAPVQIEGQKDMYYALAEDLPDLETLQAGGLPSAWQPLETTTDDEAVLLAPLEMVSARGRAKKLFDFEYVWEVYKPVEQRRWGYYTLPILYGDRLVARLDPRLDRKSMTLHILGFWPEPDAPTADPAFAAALRRGLQRFADFVQAQRLNLSAIDSQAWPLLS